jgi:hypothetical protein
MPSIKASPACLWRSLSASKACELDSDRADSTTQCSVQQITRHTQKVGRGPGALCHGLFYRLNDRRRKNSASASACWFLKLLPDAGRHRARETIPY